MNSENITSVYLFPLLKWSKKNSFLYGGMPHFIINFISFLLYVVNRNTYCVKISTIYLLWLMRKSWRERDEGKDSGGLMIGTSVVVSSPSSVKIETRVFFRSSSIK